MINLHLHTTASDGRLTPPDLVRAALAAGLTTIAVTDHDTVAGVAAARAAGRDAGLAVVAGIEMTAVRDGRDVHVLGYFLDVDDAGLLEFLEGQRAERRRRLEEIVDRLAALGIALTRPLPGETTDAARAVGRPLVARALVEAGHVSSVADAFDRFVGEGRPAFVPRRGAPPADVVSRIRAAGGLASIAHPGKTNRDDEIPAMIAAGLSAVEVYHPDHAPADVARYLQFARDRGLLVTGGSDYHGPGSGRAEAFGRVTLPAADYAALAAAAA